MKQIDFYGLKLHIGTNEGFFNYLKNHQESRIKLAFINAHCYNVACKDQVYKEALNSGFDLVLNDGIGVKIGLKMQKESDFDNLNGTDLIPEIIARFGSSKKVYFLGGQEGVAKQAMENINKKLNQEVVIGASSGFINDNKALINEINASKAEILVVGMGVPLQEKWINTHFDQLEHISLAVAGGAIIDFMSGRVSRAPKWMRSLSLEWLYRLLLEPKRLFKRYVVGNFLFVARLLIAKFGSNGNK